MYLLQQEKQQNTGTGGRLSTKVTFYLLMKLPAGEINNGRSHSYNNVFKENHKHLQFLRQMHV